MNQAYIYAAIAIACWSTVATVSKLLLSSINNIQLLWVSSAFAMVFLLVNNILTGNFKRHKQYTVRDYCTMIAIGLPGTFFYYLFYYAGAARMPASQAFIINYLWPIMSVVFACIILKEKMTVRKAAAIAVSFLGVAVVMGGELSQFNKDTLLGAVFCILGAVSYGVFTALNKKRNYNKPISLMASYFATFLITTVINAVRGDIFLPSVQQFAGFAWNGIFTVAIANTLWVMALESGATAKISNLAYITPFLSLVWTAVFLKEKISIYSLIGLVVIVFGIYIQIYDRKKAV